MGGEKWKKKTLIDKTLGDIWIKTKTAKTISVVVQKAGFEMIVTRGSIFFKLMLTVDNNRVAHLGLCKSVPSDLKAVQKSDYAVYSSTTPLIGQPGTFVSIIYCNICHGTIVLLW